MLSMFEDAYAFNSDISKWNVESVLDFAKMFKVNPQIEIINKTKAVSSFNQNLGQWKLHNEVEIGGMFENSASSCFWDAPGSKYGSDRISNGRFYCPASGVEAPNTFLYDGELCAGGALGGRGMECDANLCKSRCCGYGVEPNSSCDVSDTPPKPHPSTLWFVNSRALMGGTPSGSPLGSVKAASATLC